MLDLSLVADFRRTLEGQERLVRLPPDRTVVFVGDTHGDREATEAVFRRYLREGYVLVFLGDYVDRGPDSPGNLALLMRAKVSQPDRVVLLMGNHEAWGVSPFVPADFWRSLGPKEERVLAEALMGLPLVAVHPAGVLAVHAALPDVETLEDVNQVPLGSAEWRKMTWGDWVNGPGYGVDPGVFGRPVYGADYFFEVMERLGLRVLVRAHQPDAPLFLFENRCVTLFTSHAYGPGPRRVALLPPGKPVRSALSLEIHEL